MTKTTLAATCAPKNTASSIPTLRPPEADPVLAWAAVVVTPLAEAFGAPPDAEDDPPAFVFPLLLAPPPWLFHSGKYSGGFNCFTEVGVWECAVDLKWWCRELGSLGLGFGFMWLGVAGLLECVAATSSGFTPWAAGLLFGVGFCGFGVVVPPVGRGVERDEGSSDVNIVPEDGDRTYF